MSSPGRGGNAPKAHDINNAMAETMRKHAEGLDVPHININENSPQTGRIGNDTISGRLKLPLNVIGEENPSNNDLHSQSIRPIV